MKADLSGSGGVVDSVSVVMGMVSIIVPAYNRQNCVRRAVSSVVAQGYSPIECIVVDDGSTDETWDVLRSLEGTPRDGCVVRCFQQQNAGAPVARNRGIREARGAYISFLDSDDCLLPDAIARRVAVLEGSEYGYCYDRGIRLGPDREVLGYFGHPWPSNVSVAVEEYLFHTNSVLIRRDLCAVIGPWREELAGLQEVEYFSRLKIIGGEGAFIDEIAHEEHEYGDNRIVGSAGHSKAVIPAHLMILENLIQADRSDFAEAIRSYRVDIRWRYMVMAEAAALGGRLSESRALITKAEEIDSEARERVLLTCSSSWLFRPTLLVYFALLHLARPLVHMVRR